MAWHVKAPEAKPDDLSSAPGPHVVEGERESNELNVNGDLGKETSCHHISLKSTYQVRNTKNCFHGKTIGQDSTPVRHFLETWQNELRNSRSPHV